MASVEIADTDEKQFICSICRDKYTSPRYLPTCGHTFCENCLFRFVTNIKERGELGGQFQCPECRIPHNAPEHGDVTIEWIQTFPVNTAIVKLMNLDLPVTGMSKDRQKMCEPCSKRGESSGGEHYCLDCREVMCEGCKRFHNSFKAIEDHTIVELKTLSTDSTNTDLLKSFMKCPEHPERDLDFYSNEDDELVCGICAKASDKTFKDTIILPCLDIGADQVKEDVHELKRQLEAALDHMQLLQELRKLNKDDLKVKLKQLKDDVRQVRNQVVELMDKVVQHVGALSKAIEIEVETKSDEDTTRVMGMMKKCKQDVCLIDLINQHGSDRHKFLCSKILRKRLEDLEIHISEEDECLTKFEVALTLANDLTKLTDNVDIHTLVSLKLDELESDHELHETMDRIWTKMKLVKVSEHTVHPSPNSISPTYYGIAVTDDGRPILCDVLNGYLCMYNVRDNSLLKRKMNNPFSATCITSCLVAASVPEDKCIYMVAIQQEIQITKTFRTPYKPKSLVALRNGRIAVSWNDPPAFGVIDISGTEIVQQTYLVQDTAGRKFQSFEYLAVDERRGHAIQPCTEDTAVYCFELTGKPVFKYTDPGLVFPKGVALDKRGNIFVCSRNANSVHKLSPGGEKISIFKEGIPREPHAICCNKSDGTVWITQCSGSYDILHVYKLA